MPEHSRAKCVYERNDGNLQLCGEIFKRRKLLAHVRSALDARTYKHERLLTFV